MLTKREEELESYSKNELRRAYLDYNPEFESSLIEQPVTKDGWIEAIIGDLKYNITDKEWREREGIKEFNDFIKLYL